MDQSAADSQSHSLIVQAYYDNLDIVRDYIGRIAEDCGMSLKDIYAVQLAVDEACTNVIEHAYGGECDKSIDLYCEVTPEALIIRLHDHGEPFNPLEVPQPNFEVPIEQRDNGGLGLYLMRQLMDEIQFSFIPGEAVCDNTLTMIKKRKA
jgi:anti-sigma regulatory factor (Ser/Thr protein kinase)